jgi:hypothetical protein
MNPNDFVHLEIAYALKAQIPIIPVLVNNTQMPKPGISEAHKSVR